ncbi:MAG: tRNA1(Val) (adenine(37)-N6)-methyltransferase [Clostridiales bacterium]|nr:tRNA1(Val) (adenine(37)-N6)-methyltransferase [Clostridiales bacterium]
MKNIKENESIDDLQLNGLRIIQNNDSFKFGIDAVLLSHFTKAKNNQIMMDFGTGTGILPLLLSVKTSAKKIYGLEIQKEMAEMALRSVLMNHLEEKIEIVNMDIKMAVDRFGYDFADVITCNPPYFIENGAIKNPNDAKAISRHEVLITLEGIIEQASKVLKHNGNFFMIHRPDRLVDVIYLLKKYKLEPKEIQFISPNAEKAPNLFLIRANKGGNAQLKFHKPLYVYDLEGNYTEDIYKIYKGAKMDVFDKKR